MAFFLARGLGAVPAVVRSRAAVPPSVVGPVQTHRPAWRRRARHVEARPGRLGGLVLPDVLLQEVVDEDTGQLRARLGDHGVACGALNHTHLLSQRHPRVGVRRVVDMAALRRRQREAREPRPG
jgi:hypothetical protein